MSGPKKSKGKQVAHKDLDQTAEFVQTISTLKTTVEANSNAIQTLMQLPDAFQSMNSKFDAIMDKLSLQGTEHVENNVEISTDIPEEMSHFQGLLSDIGAQGTTMMTFIFYNR